MLRHGGTTPFSDFLGTSRCRAASPALVLRTILYQGNIPALQADLLSLTSSSVPSPSPPRPEVHTGETLSDHSPASGTKKSAPGGPHLLSLPLHRSHLFCCVYTQKTRGCPLFSSSHDTSNYPASKYPIWLLVFSFFSFFAPSRLFLLSSSSFLRSPAHV